MQPAVGNQTRFNQSLKSIANSKDQPPAVHEPLNRFVYPGIAQHGGDELPGAIRFVPGTEAPGQHEDLGLIDCKSQRTQGFLDGFRSLIAKNLYRRDGADSLKLSLAIGFTVGPRESGNDHPGTADFCGWSYLLLHMEQGQLGFRNNRGFSLGEYFLQRCVQRADDPIQRDGELRRGLNRRLVRTPQPDQAAVFKKRFGRNIPAPFDKDGPDPRTEQERNILEGIDSYPDLVADGHFGQGRGDPAPMNRPRRGDQPFPNGPVQKIKMADQP